MSAFCFTLGLLCVKFVTLSRFDCHSFNILHLYIFVHLLGHAHFTVIVIIVYHLTPFDLQIEVESLFLKIFHSLIHLLMRRFGDVTMIQ